MTNLESHTKILLVDDDVSMRLLGRLILEAETSFAVFEAVNGKDALDKAAEIQPDLILMDIMMPEMNGITACHYLKRNEETASIPVVVVSALVSADWKEAAVAAGACAYLTKPLDRNALLQVVHKLLHTPQEHRMREGSRVLWLA